MTVWTVVLVVSMATPIPTPWMRMAIPDDQMPARLLPITSTEITLFAPRELSRAQGPSAAASRTDVAAPEHTGVADWRLVATGIYVLVGSTMMIRLLIGLLLMRRALGDHPGSVKRE